MSFRDLVDELAKSINEDDNVLTVKIPKSLKPKSKLFEGQWKKYDNDYDIRLDMRPDNQGGNQLHIRKRDGSQWAYRHTGEPSEPNKYRLQATRAVADIVRNTFNLPPDQAIEIQLNKASSKPLLAEAILRS